ncbi:tetratricopeptide repeat protein [Rhizobium sp. P32RR-XVIII]|uniref:tetratricopeptide repeat protein n=1 Tax=Rhizobium sp. P32RR-XVIII TaxID=2726738 RepID=UPI00145699B6|nr:tetratricopeptide repeat protein [Rhizobium sp. P32RR-XVIII]NLS06320.1 tetratricopeptide repeat protein [Rhizobium sp. P32RR-XVIII]
MIERVRKCAAEGWPVPFEFTASTARLSAEPIEADFSVFSGDLEALPRLGAASKLLTRQFLDEANLPVGLKSWVEKQRSAQWKSFREMFFEVRELAADRSDWVDLKDSAKQLLEHDPGDAAVREVLLEAHRHSSRIGAVARSTGGAELSLAPATAATLLAVPTELPRLVLLPPQGAEENSACPTRALLEDITISLCSLRTVAVVAPYTAVRIRQDANKIAQLERHSISYVIDTSISGEGLFIQMIFLPSDSVLWAERFRLKPSSLASHRKQVAQMIVAAISNHLQHTEIMLADYRAYPDVYRSYLASVQHLNKFTLPDVRRARNAFRETLKMRSDFAPALAGLSRTYAWEWVLTARGEAELLVQAEETAKRAVALEPELASAHRELGLSRLYVGDVDGSLEAFDRAEGLSPHLADAVCGYADALVHASRPADGLTKIEKAIQLNPICPDDYFWIAAGASYFLGQFRQAISYIDQMRDSSSAQRLLAASYAMAGDAAKARTHRRKAHELNPHFDLDKWLSVLPVKEQWQKDLYREGLLKAGF